MNLAGMLSWSFEFEGKEYFEGFRTLATNGIDKPIFECVSHGGADVGRSRGDGQRRESSARRHSEIRNQRGAGRGCFRNQRVAPGSRDGVELSRRRSACARRRTVQVTIAGIPAGVKRVLLEHYRIDEEHSNSYAVWKQMGSPQSPTAEQYARLRRAGQLELMTSPRWLDVDAGRVTVEMALPRQATSLFRLQW